MKKVYCHIGNNEALNVAVQEELFKLGVKWNGHDTANILTKGLLNYKADYCISLDEQFGRNLTYADRGYYIDHNYVELSIPEFIDFAQKFVGFKLTNGVGRISDDGKTVSINGGPAISKEDIISLAEKMGNGFLVTEERFKEVWNKSDLRKDFDLCEFGADRFYSRHIWKDLKQK